jgi:hypothetical protein
LDENGWEKRTTYLQDLDGNIYEATLNIADGRDRRILHDVSRVHMIDKKEASARIPSLAKTSALVTKSQGRVLLNPMHLRTE